MTTPRSIIHQGHRHRLHRRHMHLHARHLCRPEHPHILPLPLGQPDIQKGVTRLVTVASAQGGHSTLGKVRAKALVPRRRCYVRLARLQVNVTIKRCRTVELDVDINVQLYSIVVWGTLVVENRLDAIVSLQPFASTSSPVARSLQAVPPALHGCWSFS